MALGAEMVVVTALTIAETIVPKGKQDSTIATVVMGFLILIQQTERVSEKSNRELNDNRIKIPIDSVLIKRNMNIQIDLFR